MLMDLSDLFDSVSVVRVMTSDNSRRQVLEVGSWPVGMEVEQSVISS